MSRSTRWLWALTVGVVAAVLAAALPVITTQDDPEPIPETPPAPLVPVPDLAGPEDVVCTDVLEVVRYRA